MGDSDRGFLPIVIVLFFGSGCAALIYEIVWFQLLQFIIGSSAISLGILLATFMGGMCLGSFCLARIVGTAAHPMRVYAWLELAIGIFGLLELGLVPIVDSLYVANATSGQMGFVLRTLVCSVCLLPPTFLMGATLPAVARGVRATPQGVAWLGFFYGGNIAGAVFGCLLAGFYLLRVFDMQIATFVAVAINGLVAAIGFLLARWMPNRRCATSVHPQPSTDDGGRCEPALPSQVASQLPAPVPSSSAAWILLAIGLSGLGALGAEVVWTRLLSLLLGGTVYTFSVILSAFLLGLGIGSSVGSGLARSKNAAASLACCQWLLAAAVTWAAVQIGKSVAFWPIDPILTIDPWLQFQVDVVRCMWVVLPASCLWGASFPLALAAAARDGHDPGKLVGGVYAANTVGAIVGALLFSDLIVPRFGTQNAQRAIVVIALFAAILAAIPWWLSTRTSGRSPRGRRYWPGPRVFAVIVLLAVAAALVPLVPPTTGEFIGLGRYLVKLKGRYQFLYSGEGTSSSVAVSQDYNQSLSFHVSGKVEASSIPADMRLQRMLGHLPAVLHPEPKSVLVVGCGAGVTAGSFLVHPGIERVVICELEPLIPRHVAPYFAVQNYNVVNDPRVEIVYDDARHFVRTCREQFDIITSDPIHPWVKGAATLYTREYFELCKRRLKPGGMISQWVPLYESSLAVVQSEFATFFDLFPEGTVWGNDHGGSGYDVVMVGQELPLQIRVDELITRMTLPEFAPVGESLTEVGLSSVHDLLGTYASSAKDLAEWLAGAERNRDRNLRLQYLAGFHSSKYWEGLIYREILERRTFPERMFLGSVESIDVLRNRFSPEPSPSPEPSGR